MLRPEKENQLEIITPKSAIDQLLAHKARSPKFSLYDTTLQKTLLYLTLGLVVLGSIAGVGAVYWESKLGALIGISLVIAGELSLVAYELSVALPEMLKLRNPEKSFVEPHAAIFNQFLIANRRYQTLFESRDPLTWATGLQAKGYATDPQYATKLISVMKAWNLK